MIGRYISLILKIQQKEVIFPLRLVTFPGLSRVLPCLLVSYFCLNLLEMIISTKEYCIQTETAHFRAKTANTPQFTISFMGERF